ncbi:kinase-like protein [Terfezia boudieri ATCC MYA-4762]|uniref:ethanolamine kinase n=1 Tax=Terfezia boudieri ATCC MYA-4762 TaxID=1051890 RepID=A0A3N4LNI9_9PEZI|nr:kinase-like protein [Terfezia boudieri ATCC MYA-4762]
MATVHGSSASGSGSTNSQQVAQQKIKFIPLSYNPHNSQSSATHLILTLFPDWEVKDLGFVRFTDGITNTLLKCVNSTKDQDKDAVLLRAYGRDTSILIDRERECTSHALLSSYGLAPALLARFNNGLLYRYVAGDVCTVNDLSERAIYLAVANRLGEWHGVLPVDHGHQPRDDSLLDPLAAPIPITENNLWGVMQRWVGALPNGIPAQAARKQELLGELRFLSEESGLKGMDGGVGLIFGHCDLLNGNVIILPERKEEGERNGAVAGSKSVHFIDYEYVLPTLPRLIRSTWVLTVGVMGYRYGTPCERAFDIANHFSEWGGFECDYNLLPTRSVRREFIRAYLKSFHAHNRGGRSCAKVPEEEEEALMGEVDSFRGLPGFYWGIWALIQETISQIDFDYAAYAEVRLREYFAWKKAFLGGEKGGLRETRWAEE